MKALDSPPGKTYCAEHPRVETLLRCGKCEKPICPRCLVQTPVGARCRACAQLRRLPIYVVTPRQYMVAAGASAAAALGVGIVWGGLSLFVGGLLSLLLAAGAGYAVGEAASSSANRKRAVGLQVVAGVAVFGAYMVSQLALLVLAPMLTGRPAALPSLVVLLMVATRLLVNPMALVSLAIGVLVAVSRLR